MSRSRLTATLRRASLPAELRTSGSPVSRGMPQVRRMASESYEPEREVVQGKKGPTAIVFLNMGGPSKTSEVGDFLSRLFVSVDWGLRELG